MTIESILRRKGTDVTTIAPEASIKRAADWLRAKKIGALVVTNGKAVLGLISEREIVHAFSRYGETAASMPVKEIMQYGATTVSPDESINRVMKLMTHHRVRHIAIGCLRTAPCRCDMLMFLVEENGFHGMPPIAGAGPALPRASMRSATRSPDGSSL